MSIDASKYTAHMSKGKFEGESTGATEYYYEKMMEGDGEEEWDGDRLACVRFEIHRDEAAAFGLDEGNTYTIEEDENGFVYGSETSIYNKESEGGYFD